MKGREGERKRDREEGEKKRKKEIGRDNKSEKGRLCENDRHRIERPQRNSAKLRSNGVLHRLFIAKNAILLAI